MLLLAFVNFKLFPLNTWSCQEKKQPAAALLGANAPLHHSEHQGSEAAPNLQPEQKTSAEQAGESCDPAEVPYGRY